MNAREILVANTKTQRHTKIITDATTLGELKNALRDAGIDYTGMTFTEGITKTSLLDDSSPLPRDVQYKGETTNNLVILLTNTKKNIASGVGSRSDAYAIIKANEWQGDVEEEYGYNYTNVSTADLWDFITKKTQAAMDTKEQEWKQEEENSYEDEEPEEDSDSEAPEFEACTCYMDLVDTMYVQCRLLVQHKVLDAADLMALSARISDLASQQQDKENRTIKVGNQSITDDDVRDMINSL